MIRTAALLALILPAAAHAQSGSVTLDPSGGEIASDYAHYADRDAVAEATTVRVLAVVIERVPPSKPNGSGWDVATGPDLEVEIVTTEGYGHARSDGPVVQDVGGDRLPVYLLVRGPRVLVDQEMVVRVFDHDRTGSDLMFRTEAFSAAEAQRAGLTSVPLKTWTGHNVGCIHFDFGDAGE